MCADSLGVIAYRLLYYPHVTHFSSFSTPVASAATAHSIRIWATLPCGSTTVSSPAHLLRGLSRLDDNYDPGRYSYLAFPN